MVISRVLFVLTVVGSAQSIDSRLGELSRKIHQPSPSPTSGERLGSALDQTRATLRQLERASSADISPVLREQRQKLALLDEAYRAEFARIESTLRSAGLSPEALAEKLQA